MLDIGLSGQSAADGLAVDRPSGLACAMMERLVAGIYTVRDEDMYRGLAQLLDLEGVFVEVMPRSALPNAQTLDCSRHDIFSFEVARHSLRFPRELFANLSP